MRQKRFLGNKTDGPSPVDYSPNNKFTEKSVSFTKQNKFIDNLNLTSPGRTVSLIKLDNMSRKIFFLNQ